MGDGAHNTRLKSLDKAVKHLQEQSTIHTKVLDSIHNTLQEIVAHKASQRAPSPTPVPISASPSSSVLGQLSMPQQQTGYKKHTPPHTPIFNITQPQQ